MDKHDATLRIALGIILGVCVIFGWWFAAIPLGIIGAWTFRRYVEIAVFALIHDLIFALDGFAWSSALYVIGAVAILFVIHMLKIAVREQR